MAIQATRRRHSAALPWLRSAALAGVTYLALAALAFYPPSMSPLLALAVGGLGLLWPGIGVIGFLIAVGIPLLAADLLAGGLFLVLGFAMLQYLSDSHARVFLVIGLAFAATLVRAEWGVAVLAGYLLGASEGAAAAFLACLVIEAAGLLLGARSLGTLATGGTAPIVDPKALASLHAPLSFGWIAPSFARIQPENFMRTVTSARDLVLLGVQPVLWAGTAAMAGVLRRPVDDARRRTMAPATTGAAAAALALLMWGASWFLKGPVSTAALAIAAVGAVVVAAVGAGVVEWVFPVVPKTRERGSMADEEADVDELLRTISAAEETLTNKHTVNKAVLLTDMKSFSRMTEELGSTETAKLVQRHRDLLLPLIAQAGGHGKATGGDGLLAAFDGTAQALRAAVSMQKALADYNAARQGQDAVLIRAGVASGEVVLDKGGRPFLGDALNRAARVMSLADGGQVFTTQKDLSEAGDLQVPVVSHGCFQLKNIAESVEIVEVLWGADQKARPPQEPPVQ